MTGNSITALITYLKSIKDTVIPKMQMVMAGSSYDNEFDGKQFVISSGSLLAPEADKNVIGPHFAQQSQKRAFPQAKGLPIDNGANWRTQGLERTNPQVFDIFNNVNYAKNYAPQPRSPVTFE